MTQRERGRKRGEKELWRCYFLMQSALRPVSSWKTTKQAVRRSVKQSGPTVNQDHSHAWQLFTVLLSSPLATPPPHACPPASHLPHPPLVTIIAWRRMIFQNSITHPLSPDLSQKREPDNKDKYRRFLEVICSSVLRSETKSKSLLHVYLYVGVDWKISCIDLVFIFSSSLTEP